MPETPIPLDELQRTIIEYYDGPDRDPEQNNGAFYLPPEPVMRSLTGGDRRIPLVVLVHGGAWKMPGSYAAFAHLSRQVAARGRAVFNVEYRRLGSGGGWPKTFWDATRIVDFIPTLLERYPQLDPGDVTLAGHSSGGQLAVYAGTRTRGYHPTRIVSLAGPLNMVRAVSDGDRAIVAALGGEPDEVPQRYARVDPIQNVNPKVQVTALHGVDDGVVKAHNSVDYIEALNAAGGDGTLILLDGQKHGTFLESENPAFGTIVDLLAGV